jgi:cytoskeletal protein CcmA (bactofilin family)
MAYGVQKSEKNLTILGAETVFNGNLSFTDDLIITGKFSGTIDAQGSLEIDKDAMLDVDSITADSIIVSGNVTGNLIAKSNVQLKSGSVITGDIKTSRLRIEDNVQFSGKVTMLEKANAVDLFSINPAEYKTTIRRVED